ncbi:hypothetical protein HK104_008411, partial [Borealophlyctis nickersoniae]
MARINIDTEMQTLSPHPDDDEDIGVDDAERSFLPKSAGRGTRKGGARLRSTGLRMRKAARNMVALGAGWLSTRRTPVWVVIGTILVLIFFSALLKSHAAEEGTPKYPTSTATPSPLGSSPASHMAPPQSTSQPQVTPAPIAKRNATTFTVQGVKITDDYSWLRNLETDPDVASYIAAENAYTDAIMKPTLPLQQTLMTELKDWNSRALRKRNIQLRGREETSNNSSPQCGEFDEGVSSFWEQGSYFYWIHYAEGKQYPIYIRRAIAKPTSSQSAGTSRSCLCIVPPGENDQIVLDVNNFVPKESSYFYMGVFEVSPYSEDLMAYSIDLVGSETFELHILNITSGQKLVPPNGLASTYYSVRWASEESQVGLQHWVYYNVIDAQWGTPRAVYRFCAAGCTNASGEIAKPGGAGRNVAARLKDEQLVYEEPDISLTATIEGTNDGSYLFIKSVGQVLSETLVVSGRKGLQNPAVLFKRSPECLYDVEHRNGYFYIRTNAGGAVNFQIVRIQSTDVSSNLTIEDLATSPADYKAETILGHSPIRFIEKIEMFTEHLVIWARENGLREFLVVDLTVAKISPLPIKFYNPDDDETSQVFSVVPGTAEDMDARLYRRFNSTCLTFTNSSLTKPGGVWAYDMVTGVTSTLVEREVAGYDSHSYRETRLWAPTASNGDIKIPISVVWKPSEGDRKTKDVNMAPPSRRPLLLFAYGAYGGTLETPFTPSYFPLLDRGFAVAICHPRGDVDMGGAWYTSGKYADKKNTFLDVRDCMDALVRMGVTSRGKIAVYGRSAGGLVAGNVVNRWGWLEGSVGSDEGYASVIVAQVPFVDPVLDMIDETVPWTAFEWYEWGDPRTDRTILNAMLVYSPYHNIPTGPLPAIMVTAGMEDPRVPYWEPTKYVAKLRAHKTNPPPSLPSSLGGQAGRDTPLLLRVTDAGHFASSGDEKLKGIAEWYAFVMTGLGVGVGG